MKIAMNRYRNIAKECSRQQAGESAFGSPIYKTVTNFSFVYANLNQSITAQINNLGSNENDTKLIATLDSRFEPLVDGVNGDQVSIHGHTYNINNVTIDDTDVMKVYRISINIKSSFSGD